MKRSKTTLESVGDRLRKAREQRGFSIDDIAKRTKMSPRIIQAIEEDEGPDLLSPVYVRSFVRMYARAVGLPEQELIQALADQPEQPAPDIAAAPSMPPTPVTPPPAAPPVTRPESAVRPQPTVRPPLALPTWRPTKNQLMIAGSAVMLFVLVSGIVSAIKHRPPRAPRPLAITPLKPKPAPKRAAAPKPRPAPVAVKLKPAPPAPKPKPAPVTPMAAALPKPMLVPSGEPLRLQVTAKERTWLRVTADGKVIFQNVLEKGKTEQWQADNELSLWLANAGGVTLTLNGRSLDSPGRRGEVMKDLRVTRSGIQAR